MRHSFLRGATIVAAGLLAWAGAEATAHAAACPTTNALYVTGSTAVEPFLKEVAARLTTFTIVYQGPGSCAGVIAVNTATPADLTGTASVYTLDPTDSTKVVKTSCDVPAGVKPDLGVSDVFATSCDTVTSVVADIGDFYGPNQVMNYIVPASSSETVISGDAAFLVYGFGIAGNVAPWTVDENLLFRRSASSGVQTMIAASISNMSSVALPPNKFKGIDGMGSGGVLSGVAGSSNANATIGILASDAADKNRATVKILAYQHQQQLVGYWPDSKPTLFDKINVRDGHYPIWGPLHFYTKKDSSGNPVNANAKHLVQYFSGKEPTPTGVDLFSLEVKGYTVPQCAMYVTRSAELGDYSDYKPEAPCYCAFDKIATGATTCKSCTADADCGDASKKCSVGYCEAK
ncbi:MAG: hypothetical protein ACXVEE_16360 [Polyangiales bacterium]